MCTSGHKYPTLADPGPVSPETGASDLELPILAAHELVRPVHAR
eukprot:CAMPEP_0181335920 /NCGR_PEP_ID=MMETSP1101-20121128/27119_1 /TAXON_ID=46948 /ORGANISM="Rhodomonas abbreviata, Strain Caron Lab Isolate" /LENGTH=43 /DNA_ID= /DNA_START= /DNA_END= /DNA_ORIENTATION=